ANDRSSQVARFAFDASVWEIWPPLAVGAALCIANEETILSSQEMMAWLIQQEVSICFLPTPMAEALLTDPSCVGMPLRALLTGGDRLHSVGRNGFGFPLINHYGPTEATVVATAGTVTWEASEGTPSIGRPIDNTRVYLLDRDLSLVAVGVAGELYIG